MGCGANNYWPFLSEVILNWFFLTALSLGNLTLNYVHLLAKSLIIQNKFNFYNRFHMHNNNSYQNFFVIWFPSSYNRNLLNTIKNGTFLFHRFTVPVFAVRHSSLAFLFLPHRLISYKKTALLRPFYWEQ